MKLRSLILATIVLLALVGTLYWSNHRKPSEEAAKPAESSPAILKLDEASITKVEIKKPGTDPVVLTKSGSGTWQITEPKLYRADQTNVSSTISSLSSLNSERVVEDKAINLQQYGLAPSPVEVDVTEKDNKSQHLLLGDTTPTGNAVYAMLSGDPRVFTIASYLKTSVAKNLDDYRDKRLLPVNADQISRLDIMRKNQAIEFGRNKDEWQILQPRPLRADSPQVGDLVSKLTEARMDLTGSDAKQSASAFASGTPVATAKVTDPSGTQELQIRKSKDNYYAKSTAVEGVYKISGDLAQSLDKGLDDFRNKKIFDVGFADPNRVEVHAGGKTYNFTRTGQDWFSNSKKMDVNTVGAFLSNLRDVAADKFAESGFANPTTDITVTWDDGKRVEKAQFAKVADGYVAKRNNEPTIYHLLASTVDDLIKSADDIKPAASK
jgi:uncharacterized protein DUF4340